MKFAWIRHVWTLRPQNIAKQRAGLAAWQWSKLKAQFSTTTSSNNVKSHWKFALLGGIFVSAGTEVIRRQMFPTLSESDSSPSPDELKKAPAPGDAKGLPFFSRADVAAHNKPDVGIWVTYKEGVYDITEFVEGHPGGSAKIMLAAGKSVDPFWALYQQHFNSAFPRDTLAPMRVGSLHPSELATAPEASPDDLYAREPARHPALRVHGDKPCSAETPCELLMDSHLTPADLLFVRHHMPVPDLRAADYRLTVEGPGMRKVELTLNDLKTKFPKRTVVATLQCSGNRRAHYSDYRKAQGIMWDVGAVGTAEYAGASLREVLRHAGLDPDRPAAAGVRHVHFYGADEMVSSIPAGKATSASGDVLLAYEMNGAPIPRDHGFPVRGVVPGHAGVRNVKWVTRVLAAPEEAEGMWQRGVAYKLLPPSVTDFASLSAETLARAVSAQELPVNSAVVEPARGAEVPAGQDTVEVKGWAFSGGGRGVVRVEASADGGATWSPAQLHGPGAEQAPDQAWAWTFWSAELAIPAAARQAAADAAAKKGKGDQAGASAAASAVAAEAGFEVMCRAVDAAGNSQPPSPESIWNLRGLNCNSWHRRRVRVVS